MHIGMHLVLRCIFSFSLRSRTGKAAASAGSSDCGDGTYVSVPSFREPRRSHSIQFPFHRSCPLPALFSKPPVPPCLRTEGQGKHRECQSQLFPKKHIQWDYWITLGKHTLSLERNAAEATSFPEGVMWRSTYGLTPHIWKYWGDSNLTRGGFSQREDTGFV